MLPQYEKTKKVIVSPKWSIIFEDVKDLLKDFVAGSAAMGLFILSNYLTNLDLTQFVGQENVSAAAAIVGFWASILSRVARKIAKESNYNHPENE